MSKMNHTMYQTGTINSLMDAVYEGDKTTQDILRHGDFGLGTFDYVNGEMIICDGICYRADVDGQLSVAEQQMKTPFAVVCPLDEHYAVHFSFASPTTLAALEDSIRAHFVSPNIVYAVRINAQLKRIDFRSEACHTKRTEKLPELLSETQRSFSRQHIAGTLVATWFPHYMANINVPDFHFHFVDDARRIGGHVFDALLQSGDVIIQEMHSVQMDFIHSHDFYQADLDNNVGEKLSQLEKGK